MINNLLLLRNVGCFDSVNAAATLPLNTLNLIYAENGRGKTTLAAILRSLATGDPIPILERRRLAALHPPHVIVSCAGGPPDAMFQTGAWNRTLSNMIVFDDVFVDQNVFSGLVVGSDHRQNLHELILGAQAITLNHQLLTLIKEVEAHNGEIRRRGDAIPAVERGNLSVDDFCALQVNPNVDDEILAAEQSLAASRQQDPIRSTPDFQQLNLPELNLVGIEQVLQASVPELDEDAATRVHNHLATVGDNSEKWIADGMRRQEHRPEEMVNECVFCAQDLTGSPVIAHYRAFFGEAYRGLQQNIRNAVSNLNNVHSPDAHLSFERATHTLAERRQFWSQFADIPELKLDSATIVSEWNNVRDRVAELLTQKQASSLDAIAVTEDVRAAVDAYTAHRAEVSILNGQLITANQIIVSVKQQAATANPSAIAKALYRLKATKARYTPATAALCDAYLAEKQAKKNTEQKRNQARQALEQYRTTIFPAYEAAINRYLQRFNAGYQLDNVQASNTRGGPTCTYNVVINNTPITVGGGTPQPGEHSFRNVLSAGDRNALALAFFLASLELDPNRANKVIVIDDPVSSLDEHRFLTTVQEVRRLTNRVSQVIVLSHNKPFLCRIWENADPTLSTALNVVRDSTGSTIELWNVADDAITENDRRHATLRNYLANGGPNEREIARSIRPLLEAFFRVAYPEYFPPGTLLGVFRGICDQRVGTPQEILSQVDIDELRDIVDYANRFHHDTNPSWETEVINSTQVEGFVARAMTFAKRS